MKKADIYVPGGQEHPWPISLAVRNFGIRAAIFCKHRVSERKTEEGQEMLHLKQSNFYLEHPRVG